MYITPIQEDRLFKLFLTGEPGGGKWETMKALIVKGYVEEVNKRLIVTGKGRNYCNRAHEAFISRLG